MRGEKEMNAAEQFYPVRDMESIRDLIRTGARDYKETPAFLVKTQKGGKYHEITHTRTRWEPD